MAKSTQNLNEEQNKEKVEKEEKAEILNNNNNNDKDDDEDGGASTDDSQKTEPMEQKKDADNSMHPAFNQQTGEIRINCVGTCRKSLMYVRRLIYVKELIYGAERTPRNLKCHECNENIGPHQQTFYCPSGMRVHAARFYCAPCILCQIQRHLQTKNDTLGTKEKLSGDTMIENIGKMSTFSDVK